MNDPPLGTAQAVRGLILAERGPVYMRGFDDATNWLLDPRPDSEELMRSYHKPPEGLDGCEGCKGDGVAENDCPRCCYDLGFTEGASK